MSDPDIQYRHTELDCNSLRNDYIKTYKWIKLLHITPLDTSCVEASVSGAWSKRPIWIQTSTVGLVWVWPLIVSFKVLKVLNIKQTWYKQYEVTWAGFGCWWTTGKLLFVALSSFVWHRIRSDGEREVRQKLAKSFSGRFMWFHALNSLSPSN